jgi:tripartite-type tricarboxylate transporter receptor subunit TctC
MGAGTLTMAIASYQGFATVGDKGIRPIAVTTQHRCSKLPDVPTLIEQGMKAPIARLEGGVALSANSAVPAEILDLLAKLAVDGNDTPRAKGLRENFAIPDMTKGRADAQRMWREDAAAWIKEVEALGGEAGLSGGLTATRRRLFGQYCFKRLQIRRGNF